jgi:hypothetical protein
MADLLHLVGIKKSVDNFNTALATREGQADRWTNNTQGESKVGELLQFRFSADGSEIGGFDMQVLELDPAKRVRWQVIDGPAEWIDTNISWDLKQEGAYAVILFKHQGWKEPVEFMYHCSTKWAIFLMSLKSLLETGKGAPNPDDIKIDNWN